MAVITLDIDSGVFCYEDYHTPAKAVLQLREQLPTDGFQEIFRDKNNALPSAVLVSPTWFDTQITSFAQNSTNLPDYKIALWSDDALGLDLPKFVDLINNNTQVVTRIPEFSQESQSHTQYLVIGFYDTAVYYENSSANAMLNAFQSLGGKPQGYLLNLALYNLLAAAAAPSAKGLLSALRPTAGAVPETFTIALTSATAFTVTGSVSGSLPAGTVGVPYVQPPVSFLLDKGTTAFVSGDTYTVKLVSAAL